MNRRFTNRQKIEGELLVRRMSQKAQLYYSGTDTIGIYADDRNDNDNIYVKDIDGVREYTFDSLQAEFEACQDEMEMEDD